jgi:ATP-binding cassette subfamily B protein
MALAVLSGVLSRAVDYFDNLLADRYTHHVSVEVMRKAASLDVTVYEDPVFYDRLERARVQATDRLAMIQQMGRLIQLTVTAIAFSAVLVRYSPFLLLLLVAGIIPAFLGESHFAFLTYAKNFHQTPWRREMDYLRQVGGRTVYGAFKTNLRRERCTQPPPSFLGWSAGDRGPVRLLRRICL